MKESLNFDLTQNALQNDAKLVTMIQLQDNTQP